MLKNASRLVWITLFTAFFATTALGQAPQQGEETFFQDSMQDLTVVLYGGIGGMVLGLSTLSFVKHPSKKVHNVVVGGALGVAAGVAVVIYNQAMKSRSVLPQAGPDNTPSAYFKSWEREQWHAVDAPPATGPLLVAHQFSF